MKTKDESELRQSIIKRLPWLILIPSGFILPLAASGHPWTVDRLFSRGAYPAVSRVLGGFASVFGFSIGEFFVYGAIALSAALLVFNLISLIIRRLPPLRFASFLLSSAIFAGIMLNLFYFLWGFNYSRPTLYQLMGLEVKARPQEELQRLCASLITTANGLREQVDEDGEGVFTMGDYREGFKKIPAAYKNLGEKYEIFSAPVYPAKGVLNSEGMSWAGIAGIYFPYTAEANVNVHQPPLLLLSSAAHETAHFLGFAREDEANFIAYLACTNSDDPSVRYSGVMLALIHCANKLYETAPEKYTPLRELYGAALLRDIAAYNKYWDSYEGEVEEAFDSINDNYLKFNRQDEGIKSYGMMVDLLLAYYAQ